MRLDRYTDVKFYHWNDKDTPLRETEAVLTWCGQEFSGVATCNPCDQYRKAIGRKLALSRALKAARLSKLERKSVWDTLFERVNMV